MESMPQSPNEVLTPIYVGEELVYIPVIEYYSCRDLTPQQLIARIAIIKSELIDD